VGSTKIAPASRMPRRLTTISSKMPATLADTRWVSRAGTKATIAWTPAVTETATTVR
jgi:hypothetical protein